MEARARVTNLKYELIFFASMLSLLSFERLELLCLLICSQCYVLKKKDNNIELNAKIE